MTFFDKREIIDLIRHEIRIEDDTGIASRVIRPPTKRSKYGGLPLNFRISVSDDEDEELEDFYTIPLYEETSGTRDLIATRLISRTDNNEEHKKKHIVELTRKPSKDLFVAQPIPEVIRIEESMISKNIDRDLAELQSPLNEFSIFQAPEGANSKKILILYTNDDKEVILRIPVSVLPSTRVFQLINFCHYKYFQATGEELPGNIGDYELFMAEEDEEIDTDFPEIDRSRLLSEVDFACLALVRKDIEEETDTSSRTITLYIPKGPSYRIHVPDQDVPFSWLIDEFLRLREEDTSIVQVREYNLEPVDQFDLTMDLTKPISSTNCNEFVIIRKNSSRAGYHPQPERGLYVERPMLDRLASVMSPVMPMTPGFNNPRSSGIFEFPEPDFSGSSETQKNGEKEQIVCFRVERLHRLKPKWTANLIFYCDELEVNPFASESDRRKSFLPQQYQKTVKVLYDQLVDVKITDREKSPKETVPVVVITWLPFPMGMEGKMADTTVASVMSDFSTTNWKTIQLECKSKEDATEILNYLVPVMREYAPQKVWAYSQNGQKRPSAAAEMALLTFQSDSASTSSGKKKNRFKSFARLSRILLKPDRKSSTSLNPALNGS